MLPKEKLRISQTTVDLVYPILWCFCFWVFHPLISSERHGCGGRKCLATGSLFSKQFVPKKTSGQKEWETRTHGLGELINWKAIVTCKPSFHPRDLGNFFCLFPDISCPPAPWFGSSPVAGTTPLLLLVNLRPEAVGNGECLAHLESYE